MVVSFILKFFLFYIVFRIVRGAISSYQVYQQLKSKVGQAQKYQNNETSKNTKQEDIIEAEYTVLKD